MIKNEKVKAEVVAKFDAAKFGNRQGNKVKMSAKSRYAYLDGKFCDAVMIVGNIKWAIKKCGNWIGYYNYTGVLQHEEIVK